MSNMQPPVRLKDAKFSEFGQVPVTDFIELAHRVAMLLGSSVCAGIGSGSFAIGMSVFFGLLFLNRNQ